MGKRITLKSLLLAALILSQSAWADHVHFSISEEVDCVACVHFTPAIASDSLEINTTFVTINPVAARQFSVDLPPTRNNNPGRAPPANLR